jgi:hypothetical protein
MDFARVRRKLERVKRPQVKAMQQAEWPAQPTRQVRAPKASQPVEPQVLGNRREQVKSPRQETVPVV